MKKEKPVKFLQVFETTKEQVVKQAKESELSIRDYVQILADTHQDDTLVKIDNDVIDTLKEQALLTIWNPSEYLRIVLSQYKSDINPKRRK